MEREIERHLKEWRDHPRRMPLLVRGARQVGKTFVVEKFGRELFDVLVVVNFERQPEMRTAFENLDPQKVVAQLELLTGKRIVVGRTLLFLDEIQACPRAITALRYFKEEMPEMHVIGAGSLLEFAIEEENISFPVGRVQYLYMHPLSFREYLRATGEGIFAEQLGEFTLDDPPSEAVHAHGLKLVRQYLLTGGMPAVVVAFRESGSFKEAALVQQSLMQTYRDDFGKYAKRTQHQLLQLLFERAPALVGQYFKYSKIDPDTRAREVKAALDRLCHAGLTQRIYATAANGIPLRAEVNPRKFKLLFLDIGMLQRAFRIDPRIVWEKDVLQINNGQLAEQFVGQELTATNSPFEDRGLYFWERVQTSGAAEVDYVVRAGSLIVPLEVKAGSTGRLRSLQTFMREKRADVGVRVSQHPLGMERNILSVPLYMVGELARLVDLYSGRP